MHRNEEMNEVRHSLKTNTVLNIIKQCSNIIFPLFTYPYITRILGAENLGRYSFADSVVGYFGLLAALGIPTYAIREGARIRNKKDEIIVFSAELFLINLISTVLSCAILLFLIITVPKLQKNALLLYILSVNIFANVLGRDWINSIYEDFLYISIRYIAFQLIALILIFASVKQPKDYVKYAIIMLIANSGGYIINFFYTQKYVPIQFCRGLNLKKHFRPIILLFCTSIAVSIYIKSDITILGFLRTDEEVGIYTLSSKIYTIMKALLNAIIAVAIPRLSNCLGENEIVKYGELLERLRKVLSTFIFPSVIFLFMLSSQIMQLIGGEDYLAGSKSLSILCVALIFAVFGCFYSQGVLVVNRKEKYFLYATIVSALVNIVLNLTIIPRLGMEGAAATTVISELLVVLVCWFYSKDYVNLGALDNMKSIGVGCLAIVLVSLIIRIEITNIYMQLITSIIFAPLSYFVVLICFRNEIVIEVLTSLRKR